MTLVETAYGHAYQWTSDAGHLEKQTIYRAFGTPIMKWKLCNRDRCFHVTLSRMFLEACHGCKGRTFRPKLS